MKVSEAIYGNYFARETNPDCLSHFTSIEDVQNFVDGYGIDVEDVHHAVALLQRHPNVLLHVGSPMLLIGAIHKENSPVRFAVMFDGEISGTNFNSDDVVLMIITAFGDGVEDIAETILDEQGNPNYHYSTVSVDHEDFYEVQTVNPHVKNLADEMYAAQGPGEHPLQTLLDLVYVELVDLVLEAKIRVEYCTNGFDKNALQDQLYQALQDIVSRGGLTGSTAAIVEDYRIEVETKEKK